MSNVTYTTGQFRQGRSLASSLEYEIQTLLIYDGPQLLEGTDLTNHQLGSNLHKPIKYWAVIYITS